jgi:hypothetical protein
MEQTGTPLAAAKVFGGGLSERADDEHKRGQAEAEYRSRLPLPCINGFNVCLDAREGAPFAALSMK